MTRQLANKLILILISIGARAVHAFEWKTAGYASKPKYYLLGDGTVGGLCVAIVHAVEKADPAVSISGYETLKYTSFERVNYDLRTGDIDVYCRLSTAC